MTNTPQQPGGVAGRVIAEIRAGRRDVLESGRLSGARTMHDELSAEARAMIETPNLYVPLQEAFTWSCELEYQRGFEHGLRAAFERLGLDIDHDETEGE